MKPRGDEIEPAVLNAIMLWDHVIREAGTGKVSLIGCFNVFHTVAFPFPAPKFFVTPFLTNFSGRQEAFNLAVRIEDPHSGHVYSSVEGSAEVNTDKEDFTFDRDQVMDFPVPPFEGVTFREAGTKKVVVLINGGIIGERQFNVVKLEAPGISMGEGNQGS